MKTILISGGCGFLGSNIAFSLKDKGLRICVLDNLTRVGSEKNLAWLQSNLPVEFFKADVRLQQDVEDVFMKVMPDVVFHLAGQVAMTTSIANPRLAALAIGVAQAEGIPHQVTVRRSGGTDAGSFHLANHGVPCIVLGVPSRYIHSHNAIIDLNDHLHMITLIIALVRRLDKETVDGLTAYL